MYTKFLRTLADISAKLDEAVTLGGGTANETLPAPYLVGTIDVYLENDKVGEFLIEDDWVIYTPKES